METRQGEVYSGLHVPPPDRIAKYVFFWLEPTNDQSTKWTLFPGKLYGRASAEQIPCIIWCIVAS